MQVHAHRLGPRVVGEQGLVVAVAQQVGMRRLGAGAALVFLHAGAGQRRRRRRAAVQRARQQQRLVRAPPGDIAVAEQVVQAQALDAVQRGAAAAAHPELGAAGGVALQQVALAVGAPAEAVPEPASFGQADAPLGPAAERAQAQAQVMAAGQRRQRLRVEAQAGQAQLRPVQQGQGQEAARLQQGQPAAVGRGQRAHGQRRVQRGSQRRRGLAIGLGLRRRQQREQHPEQQPAPHAWTPSR